MKVLASHPVGEDPDVLAFDPGLKRLYVSAESEKVTVFRENGRDLVSEGTLSIPPGKHRRTAAAQGSWSRVQLIEVFLWERSNNRLGAGLVADALFDFSFRRLSAY